ncbi:GTP cyclohydrolase I [Micromonospora zhanjiangensis]|uniref:GTP cyclohydrolase 1 n=1 Tax=Micromonospora zhanjiangensis TaxID=1522057 RepID=A0ABV8KIK9_9ACTN
MTITAKHVVNARPARDLAAATAAAAAFLEALGVDLSPDSLRDTPARMTRAYAELLTSREFKLTTFDNDEGYDELVMARNIPIRSVCEHHLLPFVGVAHVGYLPAGRILGLSKLARVVEMFAHGTQVQEVRCATTRAPAVSSWRPPDSAADHARRRYRNAPAGGRTRQLVGHIVLRCHACDSWPRSTPLAQPIPLSTGRYLDRRKRRGIVRAA